MATKDADSRDTQNGAHITTEFVTGERFDAVNVVLENVTPEQVALFGEHVIPRVCTNLAGAAMRVDGRARLGSAPVASG